MLLTLSIYLKIERPCQAFLACSLTLPLSLSLSFLFPSLSPPPPLSTALFSNSRLSFPSSVSCLLFLSVLILFLLFCAFFVAPFVMLSCFLSLFSSCWYKVELWRYSTLQNDKCCSVSALNSSQCCTVMQTSMRAVREKRVSESKMERVMQSHRAKYTTGKEIETITYSKSNNIYSILLLCSGL